MIMMMMDDELIFTFSGELQRGMLTQLAARLRARQGGAEGPGGGVGVILGEDGETVIVDDNCEVSLCEIAACFWVSRLDAYFGG